MKRLLRHEGWHVVLYQRQEEFNHIYRMTGEEGEAQRHYLGIAASAAVEHRIERQLWKDGWDDGEGRAGVTLEILRELAGRFLNAIEVKYEGEHIRRTYETAVSLFSELVTHLAYVAAEDPEVRESIFEGLASTREWIPLVGEHWLALLRTLNQFEPAGEPMNRATVETV